MDRKIKLATLILLEFEGLLKENNTSQTLVLAQELTRDAVALAKLIQEENEEIKEVA